MYGILSSEDNSFASCRVCQQYCQIDSIRKCRYKSWVHRAIYRVVVFEFKLLIIIKNNLEHRICDGYPRWYCILCTATKLNNDDMKLDCNLEKNA